MADPDTDEPLKGEAQAQDEQTLMPWIWGGLGLLVIAVFVAVMVLSGGHHVREPAAAAPTFKTPS
ncbi:MAG TPA: hypothetical protein VN814_23770 [Caulobacteraceae bacterium]|nr:hypothetical protein [Caulobacteraceae bacterium]